MSLVRTQQCPPRVHTCRATSRGVARHVFRCHSSGGASGESSSASRMRVLRRSASGRTYVSRLSVTVTCSRLRTRASEVSPQTKPSSRWPARWVRTSLSGSGRPPCGRVRPVPTEPSPPVCASAPSRPAPGVPRPGRARAPGREHWQPADYGGREADRGEAVGLAQLPEVVSARTPRRPPCGPWRRRTRVCVPRAGRRASPRQNVAPGRRTDADPVTAHLRAPTAGVTSTRVSAKSVTAWARCRAAVRGRREESKATPPADRLGDGGRAELGSVGVGRSTRIIPALWAAAQQHVWFDSNPASTVHLTSSHFIGQDWRLGQDGYRDQRHRQ
jgi:hypothetical protein